MCWSWMDKSEKQNNLPGVQQQQKEVQIIQIYFSERLQKQWVNRVLTQK